MLKETKEFFGFFVAIAVQSFVSLKDGFQAKDLIDYLDEILSAGPAFTGLDQLKSEAVAADRGDVEAMFTTYELDLIKAGLDEDLAAVIVSGLKTGYYAFRAIEKGKAPQAA